MLAEDYGMMHFEPRTLDADVFWGTGPKAPPGGHRPTGGS